MIERLYFNALLLDVAFLLQIPTTLGPAISTTTLLSSSYCHVEVSNFVCILTRSRYLDRSSPIVVEVAETVGELLELDLFQRALIKRHIEVSRQHAALIGSRWHHEEVEGACLIRMLHQTLVHNAARRWIDKTASVIFDKEALGDSLIDNDKSDFGLLCGLVVEFGEGLPELDQLLVDHLLSLGITDAVAEDNEVRGQHALVLSCKDIDCLL